MTEAGLLERTSAVIGRFRGLFLPFGLFALLAVGIHSGSNKLDDLTFVGLNFFDALVDDLMTTVVGAIWRFFGASEATTATAIFKVVDLINLEVKDSAARFVALIVELVADVMLALPVFLFRERDVDLRRFVQKTFKDPTILRVVAPFAAGMASLAGISIITREVQVATGAKLLSVQAATSFAGTVAGVLGIIALLIVTWRLGWVVTVAAARWAEIRALDDERNQVKPIKRRFRGWFTALVALPISLFAFSEAINVIGRFSALIPG